MRDNKFGTYSLLFIAIMGLFIATSCKKDSAENNLPKAPELPPAPSTPIAEPVKEKPVYVYSGDRFRDPFLPAGQSTNYQPDAVFDPQRAKVMGIIFGKDYKSAVLSVGGSGTYFIKGGKIFDVMGKSVEGYGVKIFVDKVVLSGEADNVFELKIQSSDEEAKTL